MANGNRKRAATVSPRPALQLGRGWLRHRRQSLHDNQLVVVDANGWR